MWCEPFIFQKWCSSALHDGTSQNRQKPPRFSHDLQRMTKSASGGGNRSSGRHPDLPVRSISPKPTPKSPQIFWTLTKTWSLCWRRWVWSWEPRCACGAGRGADRERETHASARAPVSARWFPVRGPTRIIALRTEIGCACWRGGGRGCIFWGGGLPSTCSFACVASVVFQGMLPQQQALVPVGTACVMAYCSIRYLFPGFSEWFPLVFHRMQLR